MRQQVHAFDTYKHIKELQGAGFKEAQAKIIIKSLVESRDTDISHLATKEQVSNLENKMTGLENKMTGELKALESKTTSEIKALESKMTSELKALEASLLKWMIGTMIAFSGITIAVITAVIKL